jgi:cytochrome c heme-lyase
LLLDLQALILDVGDVLYSGMELVQLARFQGRPEDLSPKARYHLFLSKLFPNTYSSQPPFDRHDWYVRRPVSNVMQRYVIDYYSAPDDEQG